MFLFLSALFIGYSEERLWSREEEEEAQRDTNTFLSIPRRDEAAVAAEEEKLTQVLMQ